LALDTGCRAGELSNLRVADLDIDDCMGRIECNSEWRSKTRRNRPIAYSPKTAERLRVWLLKRGLKPHVFREPDDKARGHYKRIARRFQTAVKHAKIGRNVTLQDCRRTVGSLLAERGVNQRVAMEYLGHSNIATTAKFYQAVRPETLRATMLNLRPTGSEG
jgi:integrase